MENTEKRDCRFKGGFIQFEQWIDIYDVDFDSPCALLFVLGKTNLGIDDNDITDAKIDSIWNNYAEDCFASSKK